LAATLLASFQRGATAAADPPRPVRIVAFGDSLTAGFGLAAADAFPVRLEAALKGRGHAVEVANAGVSGDTTAGGLARVDWAVPDGTEAVVLELGANDALQGRDPAQARANLDAIVGRLKAKGVEVLITGMRAPRNLGEPYAARFDPIFSELAAKYGMLHYPFFLDGVALDPALNLGDGIHPNAKGVGIIVERILPEVEALIRRVEMRRAAASHRGDR
jgi:acyl-CoA thioesterase-1